MRFIAAGAIMKLLKYNARETLFFAVAWMPKGTVQVRGAATPAHASSAMYVGTAKHAAAVSVCCQCCHCHLSACLTRDHMHHTRNKTPTHACIAGGAGQLTAPPDPRV